MSIVLVGSTSGSITLQEPAVAGTTVLTLPAVSGTVITTGSPQSQSVIQVVQTVKTDTWTSTSSTWVNITDFTATITPTSASSRILVMASVAIGLNPTYFQMIRLARGGSAILVGDASGSRIQTQGMVYMYNQLSPSNAQITWSGSVVDSPASTSPLTYSVQMQQDSSQTMYVNRLQRDDNASYEPRSASSLILMEIAG
jgi:hypothetical protein